MRKTTVFLTIISLLVISPSLVFGQSKGDLLIKNATVMTASNGTLQATDILVQNGKIARIGKGLTAGSGVKTIDATGKYVSPGIIDAHSHTMLSAINEGSLAVTSMTDVGDMLLPQDVSIYRALAGGVTSALLLHGSANPIGGQSADCEIQIRPPGRGVSDCGGTARYQIRTWRECKAFEFYAAAGPDCSISAYSYGNDGSDPRRIHPGPRIQAVLG